MRIAIIGSGISGLTAAYRLHQEHEITLFEANDYIGGHTNTVGVEWEGERHRIDTGFIVHNDRTYPNFCRLMEELGVVSDPTSMSFSVRCDESGLEYNGTSLNGLFTQRLNLIRPRFYRMLVDIVRFNKESVALLEGEDDSLTVGEYLRAHKYSDDFRDRYLVPMGAAIWSCPPETFEQFPIRFIVEFYLNHGLLSLSNRPTWRVIRGGSAEYVKAMTAGFRDRIRLNCGVESVQREQDRIELRFKVPSGIEVETFDEVIFACHSDQALKILGEGATGVERELLTAFPYEANSAVLHTDTKLLPRKKRAWASWNYLITDEKKQHATVTYNMNILQHLKSKHVFCVTLNQQDVIDEEKVIERFEYAHPVYNVGRKQAQERHEELIRENRTSFCGAYWGNGFHEDGVQSALRVSEAFRAEGPVRLREEPAHV